MNNSIGIYGELKSYHIELLSKTHDEIAVPTTFLGVRAYQKCGSYSGGDLLSEL